MARSTAVRSFVRTSLALLAIPLAAAAPLDHSRTRLVSIIGIPVRPGEYVGGFALQTWGVTFLAACRIPPGWSLKAGNSISLDGWLDGEAQGGVAFLDRARLAGLHGLALVRLHLPIRRQAVGDRNTEFWPATFTGHAVVDTYGDDPHGREVPLTGANVRLTPATRCPAPRP